HGDHAIFVNEPQPLGDDGRFDRLVGRLAGVGENRSAKVGVHGGRVGSEGRKQTVLSRRATASRKFEYIGYSFSEVSGSGGLARAQKEVTQEEGGCNLCRYARSRAPSLIVKNSLGISCFSG